MNTRKIIISIVVILIVVILIFIIFKQNHIETEVDYTGYQLILTAQYGGYGIAGQNLGSGTEKKIFNISQNDILYEPTFGGLWLLNADKKEDKNETKFPTISEYSTILEIVELEENTITIKNKDKTYNIKYNQEVDISSNSSVSDGINYSYVIKITKKQ